MVYNDANDKEKGAPQTSGCIWMNDAARRKVGKDYGNKDQEAAGSDGGIRGGS